MRPNLPDDPLAFDPIELERILAEFLRSELLRTGLERYVVGLSGGIDSAVSTYLAARALGPEAVHAVLMPYRTSSASSITDAEAIVADLGISSEKVEISAIVDGFVAAAGDPGAYRLGNVMSRARMITLYDRSMALGALVLGTSNKSELLLGYGTIFGDMASAVNPIGDIYKSQIFELARSIGVPQPVIDKPPSADLWPDQSDEQELGFSYAEVDRLLHALVDARVGDSELAERGFSPERVAEIRERVRRSQFKRMPPLIAKVSLRSIGWDFRYPRDWGS